MGWRCGHVSSAGGSRVLSAPEHARPASLVPSTFTPTPTPVPLPTKLAFTVQPTNQLAGSSIAPAIKVTVQDASGATVTSSTASINMVITTPGGATLSGTIPASAVSGVATFSDVSLNRPGTYTLTASSSGLASAVSTTFTISVGAANKLAFSIQPSNAVAGVGITPDIRVIVQDSSGNTVTGYAPLITLAISNNPGGGTLSGNFRFCLPPAWRFSAVCRSKSGIGYTLSASSGTLTAATSTAFTITPGVAFKLGFTVQPGTTLAGVSIAPAVQVSVQDAQGNTVASTAAVALVITANPGGGTLSGTTTVAAIGGVATFSTLSINRPGIGYTFTATTSGLATAVSNAFTILVGTPSRLVFSAQPTNEPSAVSIAPAVQVTVQDSSGNTVTASSASIGMAIGNPGSGPGGGPLSGTTTLNAASGVAVFSNLSINLIGTGYTLTASSGGITPATSTAFNITLGPASRLAFSGQPASAAAGLSLVRLGQRSGAGGNPVASTASIVLAIGTTRAAARSVAR